MEAGVGCMDKGGVMGLFQFKEHSLTSQSVLKEISPEYSLEGLMLKLKLQYFDHLMQKANSLHWKTL